MILWRPDFVASPLCHFFVTHRANWKKKEKKKKEKKKKAKTGYSTI